MDEVRRLPGDLCAHYMSGRCTRTKDPESSLAWRCTLLASRRRQGAALRQKLRSVEMLADEADRETARKRILKNSQQEILGISCSDYRQGCKGGGLCCHQYLIYCLLLMPACPGRCEDFLLGQKHREQA